MNADLLPPLHAFPKLCRPLIPARFSENIEMLMRNEIKIIFLTEPLFPRALRLPLKLYNGLPQNKASLKEAHEHSRRYGHKVLVPPRIANENGAVLIGLEHAHALGGDPAHLRSELCDVMHA